MKLKSIIKWLCYTGLLVVVALVFRYNLTGLGMPGPEQGFPHEFWDFDSGDERMVTNRLVASREHGIFSEGGFLLDGEFAPVPYKSRTGLQGQILSFIYLRSGASLPFFTDTVKFVMDLLVAATLILYCSIVKRQFGLIAAGVVLLLIVFSDWLVFFAGSLYWVTFSFFLPFVVSFLIYPKVLSGAVTDRRFLIIVGSLVCFKALMGYEFGTNVLLSATVPVFYFNILQGKTRAKTLRVMTSVALAGAVGLGLAIALHTLQSWLYFGSLRLAIANFVDRGAYRSFASPQIHYGFLLKLARDVYKYSTLGICTMYRVDGQVKISVPMYALNVALIMGMLFRLVDIRYIPELAKKRRSLMALSAACGWGLLCSLTWFLLALDHTYSHIYMDPVMFYLPYGLLVYALMGAVVSIVAVRLWTALGDVHRTWASAGKALESVTPPIPDLARRTGSITERQA
jgi:hypothetical protein